MQPKRDKGITYRFSEGILKGQNWRVRTESAWVQCVEIRGLVPITSIPSLHCEMLHYQVSRNDSAGITLNALLLIPCVTDWQDITRLPTRETKEKRSVTTAACFKLTYCKIQSCLETIILYWSLCFLCQEKKKNTAHSHSQSVKYHQFVMS